MMNGRSTITVPITSSVSSAIAAISSTRRVVYTAGSPLEPCPAIIYTKSVNRVRRQRECISECALVGSTQATPGDQEVADLERQNERGQ
jgi:hypothetical protein